MLHIYTDVSKLPKSKALLTDIPRVALNANISNEDWMEAVLGDICKAIRIDDKHFMKNGVVNFITELDEDALTLITARQMTTYVFSAEKFKPQSVELLFELGEGYILFPKGRELPKLGKPLFLNDELLSYNDFIEKYKSL